MPKRPTQREIGFDEAVIAVCAKLIYRGDDGAEVAVREILQDFAPDLKRGCVGDLDTLRRHNLIR